MTDFDHFPPESLDFLRDLADHNNRDWFAAHKTDYEQSLKAPADAFAAAATPRLEALTGKPHTAKVFRIFRDVRFSKDKTPYHTYVRLSFTADVTGEPKPAWFFGVDPSGAAVGCGVFGYQKAALDTFRADMAGPKGATLSDLLDQLTAAGFRVPDPEMKTVPRGFPRDHPHAAMLRRKGVTAWRDLPAPETAMQAGFFAQFAKTCEDLLPLMRALGV